MKTGIYPHTFKEEHVTPLLKKTFLYKNNLGKLQTSLKLTSKIIACSLIVEKQPGKLIYSQFIKK